MFLPKETDADRRALSGYRPEQVTNFTFFIILRQSKVYLDFETKVAPFCFSECCFWGKIDEWAGVHLMKASAFTFLCSVVSSFASGSIDFFFLSFFETLFKVHVHRR